MYEKHIFLETMGRILNVKGYKMCVKLSEVENLQGTVGWIF